MKKIFVIIAMAALFCACGNSTSTSVDTVKTDTVSVDSIVVDTNVVDTMKTCNKI